MYKTNLQVFIHKWRDRVSKCYSEAIKYHKQCKNKCVEWVRHSKKIVFGDKTYKCETCSKMFTMNSWTPFPNYSECSRRRRLIYWLANYCHWLAQNMVVVTNVHAYKINIALWNITMMTMAMCYFNILKCSFSSGILRYGFAGDQYVIFTT